MRLTIEPLDLDRDLDLVHRWVTDPRSAYWQMQDASPGQVREEYRLIDESRYHHAWLGRANGRAGFLVETYDPAHSALADLDELRSGDLGMHVLVAPPDGPAVPGFTRAVFAAVLRHCFADPTVARVVVEPDIRNERIRALNRTFGFEELRTVSLATKQAMVSVLSRSDHERGPIEHPSHLTPRLLARAQRHLVAKAIAELSHERVLAPEPVGDRWRLATPSGDTTYTFAAERLALEHWAVDETSLVRQTGDQETALDVQAFTIEFAPVLGVSDSLLPAYLEELASTLAGAAWKLRHATASAADLLHADYQQIEAAMTEGHPGFIANNGRIGFDADDYTSYAPETGAAVRLLWLAGRREHTRLWLGDGATEDEWYAAELDDRTRDALLARLRERDLDPDDYLLLPVHPWQWRTKLAIAFAPDLARHDLVLLGEGPDDYQPQQSIRTFFNRSQPMRCYVKTALAVQNMGFMRGLSAEYMAATPAINDWVAAVVTADPELRARGFSVLRERATIAYTGDAFHTLAAQHGIDSPYQKMIAALWRESPAARVGPDERLATMASLLHRDAAGDSVASAMIEASPLDAASWVRGYLDAYLRPIAHCLLAHDLAFMPHGENVVLVLRDHVPIRVLLKDIGEEVAVMGEAPLPHGVERIRVLVEEDVKSLSLHTDVFDGVLRHLAGILHRDGTLDQDRFWTEVADCLRRHEADHPELGEAVATYRFRRPRFRHSCLNRLQLRNTRQMVDLDDPAQSLIYAGMLDNPVAL